MVDLSFTMIMQWINFGILLFILYYILFKPLMGFLDKRAEGIAKNIEYALDNKEKSLKLLEEYKGKLEGIRAEAQQIVSDARKTAETERGHILQRAEEEARLAAQAVRAEMQQETAKVRQELRGEAVNLALLCAAKILEREINRADHQRYLEEFLQKEQV